MLSRVFMAVCAGVAALLLLLGTPVRAQEANPPFTFSDPLTHENLTVFLICGQDVIQGHTYLSLGEALEMQKLVVYETSNVNELLVENLSTTDDVFIQAGEIVKGGKQDRVFAMDMIVPAKSGKVLIPVYCVEHGRWTPRGAEDSGKFNSSSSALPTNDLRLAATYVPSPAANGGSSGGSNGAATPANGQSAVWQSVARQQANLSNNVGSSVNAKASDTSLQLSMENQKLREMVAAYVKDILPAAGRKADAIGYAVAVNGKVRSVDVYASHALFLKLWPKMLDAASVQAVAELDQGKKYEVVTADRVKTFMAAATGGKESNRSANGRLNLVQRDAQSVVQFETQDRQQMGAGGIGGGMGGGGGRGGAVHQGWVGK